MMEGRGGGNSRLLPGVWCTAMVNHGDAHTKPSTPTYSECVRLQLPEKGYLLPIKDKLHIRNAQIIHKFTNPGSKVNSQGP